MAARGRTPGFYVYRIFDGLQTLYIGKGSGSRLKSQMRRFKAEGEIIEHCDSDDLAFAAERKWIKSLMPTENKLAGGNGGRVRPKVLTRQERQAVREFQQLEKELGEVGPRRYVARFLLRKLNELNCERWGLSKVDIFRLKDVANGERC